MGRGAVKKRNIDTHYLSLFYNQDLTHCCTWFKLRSQVRKRTGTIGLHWTTAPGLDWAFNMSFIFILCLKLISDRNLKLSVESLATCSTWCGRCLLGFPSQHPSLHSLLFWWCEHVELHWLGLDQWTTVFLGDSISEWLKRWTLSSNGWVTLTAHLLPTGPGRQRRCGRHL